MSKHVALFAWLISRTFLANEQYFSLTTNQPTILTVMAYQPSEQGSSKANVSCSSNKKKEVFFNL